MLGLLGLPSGTVRPAPVSRRYVLEVDPGAGLARFLSPHDEEDAAASWSDACAAEQYWCAVAAGGKVYGIPSSAERVLEIDPSTSAVRFIGPQLMGDLKYATAVHSPVTGKIYAPPYGASRVLQSPAAT